MAASDAMNLSAYLPLTYTIYEYPTACSFPPPAYDAPPCPYTIFLPGLLKLCVTTLGPHVLHACGLLGGVSYDVSQQTTSMQDVRPQCGYTELEEETRHVQALILLYCYYY